jgi:hypothetical protein
MTFWRSHQSLFGQVVEDWSDHLREHWPDYLKEDWFGRLRKKLSSDVVQAHDSDPTPHEFEALEHLHGLQIKSVRNGGHRRAKGRVHPGQVESLGLESAFLEDGSNSILTNATCGLRCRTEMAMLLQKEHQRPIAQQRFFSLMLCIEALKKLCNLRIKL